MKLLKIYFYVDLNLLSKHRTPLMGIAALMIILCHANGYGVAVPHAVRSLLTLGNMGVDIFLFLSGIGCFYSLSKGPDTAKWYKKRFVRIFIPYALMQIPFWMYKLVVGDFEFIKELMVFSTIDFWTNHVGAWYVALLVPLYIFTPPIYFLLKDGKNRLLWAITLLLLLVIACNIDISRTSGLTNGILHNLQWAFCRVASFIIGMYIAPFVKRGVKINVLSAVFVSLALYIGVHRLISKDIFMWWCLILPMSIVFAKAIDWLKKNGNFYKFISWMGIVSLESYLANIYLNGSIKDFVYRYGLDGYNIMQGHYFEYSCVIILGMILSYAIHRMSVAVMPSK